MVIPPQPINLPRNWRSIPRRFFTRPPESVAPTLLGKILSHRTSDGLLAGRIVEVEAYLGPHTATEQGTPDPASHSFRGITERNRVMFGPPGYSYVYFIYGMYYCVNVTCEPEGRAGCILVRALEPILGQTQMAANRRLAANVPLSRLTGGPGRLCQALRITRALHNGLDLLDPKSSLRLHDDGFQASEIAITPRIGIRQAAELPLRFALAHNPCVSSLRPFKASV